MLPSCRHAFLLFCEATAQAPRVYLPTGEHALTAFPSPPRTSPDAGIRQSQVDAAPTLETALVQLEGWLEAQGMLLDAPVAERNF
eukprot:4224148-Pleurochrysis_carterae.AAC.2